MQPIGVLEEEHRLIERVVGALERYCLAIQSQDDVDPGDLARFVTFIDEHNDHIHHEKEEDILFETMVEHGFPRDHGTIATVLKEHHAGRAFAQALAELAEIHRGGRSWTAQEREQISDAGRGYAGLLRPHIVKEDRILFPAAAANLSDEAMQRVASAFADFEGARSDRKARLRADAEDLIARYLR